MECQKVINLLDNIPNQTSIFSTNDWVEINNEWCGTYNTNSQFKFKTSMLITGLCDYSDTYILVKGTIWLANTEAAAPSKNDIVKKVILKNWTPFTGWISKMNNKQIDNAKDTDIVMPKHILIEYSNNYSETSESLRQYYRDEPVVDAANGNILDFNVANDFNNSLKLKIRRNRQQWHKRCWHNSAIKIGK